MLPGYPGSVPDATRMHVIIDGLLIAAGSVEFEIYTRGMKASQASGCTQKQTSSPIGGETQVAYSTNATSVPAGRNHIMQPNPQALRQDDRARMQDLKGVSYQQNVDTYA